MSWRGQGGAAALLMALALPGGAAPADPLAQAKLHLRGGPGVAIDLPAAYAEFDAAARANHPAAAYYRGLMLKNGLGVVRDGAAAVRSFERAAEGGVPQAMFILANMLLRGDGVPRNEAAARRWIDKADALDLPEAAMAKAIGLRDGSMGYTRDDAAAEQQMKMAEHAMEHRPAEP